MVLLYLINFKLQAQIKNDPLDLWLVNYNPLKVEELMTEIQKLSNGNIDTLNINKYKYKQSIKTKLNDEASSDTLKLAKDYKRMNEEVGANNKISQFQKKSKDPFSKESSKTINYDRSMTINIDDNEDINKGRDMNNNRDRNRDLKRDKNRDRGRDKNRDRDKGKNEIRTKIKIKIK